MPMLLSFTPNPCLERTLQLANISPQTSQRISSDQITTSAGGKGLNAARVAARFGTPVLAIAPVGGRQLAWLQELAGDDGIATDFLSVAGDTRVCTNIVHDDGTCTEFVENGAPLEVAAGTELLEKWRRHLPRAGLAIIGGAYPPAPDRGFELHAALLCRLATLAGVRVIYDGRGAAFSRALSSQHPPWAIKPNLLEAEQILGHPIASEREEIAAVRELHSRGAKVVLLSCGARGLYVGHAGGIEWIEAPRVQAVSGVGCGDSLVGAFAAKILAGMSLIEAARWGVAAGSASAAQVRPASITQGEAAALLPQVRHRTREIALSLG